MDEEEEEKEEEEGRDSAKRKKGSAKSRKEQEDEDEEEDDEEEEEQQKGAKGRKGGAGSGPGRPKKQEAQKSRGGSELVGHTKGTPGKGTPEKGSARGGARAVSGRGSARKDQPAGVRLPHLTLSALTCRGGGRWHSKKLLTVRQLACSCSTTLLLSHLPCHLASLFAELLDLPDCCMPCFKCKCREARAGCGDPHK